MCFITYSRSGCTMDMTLGFMHGTNEAFNKELCFSRPQFPNLKLISEDCWDTFFFKCIWSSGRESMLLQSSSGVQSTICLYFHVEGVMDSSCYLTRLLYKFIFLNTNFLSWRPLWPLLWFLYGHSHQLHYIFYMKIHSLEPALWLLLTAPASCVGVPVSC